MKENQKAKRPSGAPKKNGFYVALYSSVGLMLVLAGIIGYNNFSTPKTTPNDLSVKTADISDLAPVGKDTVEKGQAYLTPSDRESDIGTAVSGNNPDANYSLPHDYNAGSGTGTPSAQVPVIIDDLPVNSSLDPGINISLDGEDEISIVIDDESGTEQDSSGRSSSSGSREFTAFDDSDKMAWPVFGDIVMDYSVDHVIYDKTLNQYRINDTLCIAADAGTEVRSAADGIVISITNTKEDGQKVVIDHGNGWRTTYTQLQDTVLVEVGDVVSKGQVIGGVGNPSIYGILLGQHLGFAISKDDRPMNPKDILAIQ